jgi:hypothetical protein
VAYRTAFELKALLAVAFLALTTFFALTVFALTVFALKAFLALIAFLLLTKRIDESLLPFASVSLALATLAFLAVFNVLIRDFFWMDMGGSCFLNFCLSFRRNPYCNTCANLFRTCEWGLPNEKSITYGEQQRYWGSLGIQLG